MRRILLFVISMSVFVFSQDTTESADTTFYRHEMSYFFISGYSLAYSYHLTKANRIRANIRFSTNISNSTREYSQYYVDPIVIDTTEHDLRSYSLQVDLHYIAEIINSNNVGFYLGTGPTVSYYENNEHSNIRGSSFEQRISYGISGIVGTSGRITNFLSIYAEYYLSYSLFDYENKNNSRKIIDNGYNFVAEDIKLGVSFHF